MNENESELGKRRIDQIRDSAGSFTIGDDSDGAIKSFVTIGGRLYVIKEKSIYALALADDIDPEADFFWGGFAVEFANLGKMVRNMRHCLEHPKPTQRIDVNDYRITVSRVLEEPTITIIHNETPLNATRINQFMRFYIEQA